MRRRAAHPGDLAAGVPRPVMTGFEFRVIGRVQGVGFRHYVHQAAMRIGVTGWVRNESDGSVVGEAFGDEDALAELRAALESGPMWSRVDSTEVRAVAEPTPRPAAFEVRYNG